MIRFRVYYSDGTTFDGPVEDAPGQGVIVVAQENPDVGRELLHAKDYYVWDEDQWNGVDTYGLYDYLAQLGWRKVLAGRTVKYATYSEVFDAAVNDDYLPEKTALLVDEEPKL